MVDQSFCFHSANTVPVWESSSRAYIRWSEVSFFDIFKSARWSPVWMRKKMVSIFFSIASTKQCTSSLPLFQLVWSRHTKRLIVENFRANMPFFSQTIKLFFGQRQVNTFSLSAKCNGVCQKCVCIVYAWTNSSCQPPIPGSRWDDDPVCDARRRRSGQ